MLILPKWLNKFLTPEEEAELKDPSKRIFTFGLLASVATLALPALPTPEFYTTIGSLTFIQEEGVWKPVGDVFAPLSFAGHEWTRLK